MMKEDFPTFPFLSMLFVTAGCTAIGWAIGGPLGDVYGLAIGICLGYGVFALFVTIGEEQRIPHTPSPWRLDRPAQVLRGPKRWLSRMRQRMEQPAESATAPASGDAPVS